MQLILDLLFSSIKMSAVLPSLDNSNFGIHSPFHLFAQLRISSLVIFHVFRRESDSNLTARVRFPHRQAYHGRAAGCIPSFTTAMDCCWPGLPVKEHHLATGESYRYEICSYISVDIVCDWQTSTTVQCLTDPCTGTGIIRVYTSDVIQYGYWFNCSTNFLLFGSFKFNLVIITQQYSGRINGCGLHKSWPMEYVWTWLLCQHMQMYDIVWFGVLTKRGSLSVFHHISQLGLGLQNWK